ncbi:MAG TPA: site-specific integrase [Alphaproteobacteria bacterium]|nr:site-specific integrase [Alphaproteobacteria bacterium]
MPKKSQAALTAMLVEKVKPPAEGVTEIWDAAMPGFGLRIFAATKIKSWCLMCRAPDPLTGKRKQFRWTIGRYPEMSLQEARQKAGDWKDLAAKGINPKARVDAESGNAAGGTGALTFGAVAEKYIKRELPALARPQEIASIIRNRLMPAWEDRPIEGLRKRDAIKLTDALIDAGTPHAARRLYETAIRIFRWAHERDEIEINPLAGLRPPVKKKARREMPNEEELRALWKSWDSEKIGYPFGPLQMLLLVTGQRRGEVAGMSWSEVDLEAREWIIPAERCKSDRDHLVPLSDLAVEILRTLPRFKRGDLVFSTTGGEKPVSGFSKAKLLADKVSGVSGWRMHDLRRVVRSNLSALRVPEVVGERVINHGPKGLAKNYNLHEFVDQKKEALDLWADALRKIIERDPEPDAAAETLPENVVPMIGGRR